MGAGGWRESRLLPIVAGLAVLATNPVLLATFKATNQWPVRFASRSALPGQPYKAPASVGRPARVLKRPA